MVKLLSTFPLSGFEDLAADASFGERLVYGLKICLIGMLVVFVVLAFLWGVLACFKLYYNASQKKKAKAPAVVNTPASVAPAQENEELTVAVATAAIAAARKESDAAFKIISIKKIN